LVHVELIEMTEEKQRRPHRPSLASIVRQATKAGVRIDRIEVDGGKITIFVGNTNSTDVTKNPWDVVLGNGGRSGP
jgi:hypothetical protein